MEQKSKGTKEQRNKGTKELRIKGKKEQRNKGTTQEQRNKVTKELRNKGTKGQRNKGTKKQRNKGTKEQSNKGTKEKRKKGHPSMETLEPVGKMMLVLLSTTLSLYVQDTLNYEETSLWPALKGSHQAAIEPQCTRQPRPWLTSTSTRKQP